MIIGNLEAEIITFKKVIQQKNMHNNSKVLNNIINSKRPHHDKSGLGYDQTKRGSSSKTTDQETQPRSYAKTRGDKKFYREDQHDTPTPRRFRFQNQRQ
jgi:hypothetical protein